MLFLRFYHKIYQKKFHIIKIERLGCGLPAAVQPSLFLIQGGANAPSGFAASCGKDQIPVAATLQDQTFLGTDRIGFFFLCSLVTYPRLRYT